MTCPQTVVKLYRGLVNVYTNQTNVLVRIKAVVELKDKDQSAGPLLAQSIILCGHQVYRRHHKSIAVLVHGNNTVEIAKVKFLNI